MRGQFELTPDKSLRTLGLIALVGISFLGSFWKLWEQDLYWLIRDGHDMLSLWALPQKETWSSTVYGERWINVYWLSSIFFYLASLTGENGLVILRSLMSVILFFLCYRILLIRNGKDKWAWHLLPLFYLAIWYKIQLRPDFVIMILYATTILLWLSNHPISYKFWTSLGISLFATNVHQGAAPLVIGLTVFYSSTSDTSLSKRFLWSLAFIGTYVIHPYGFELGESVITVMSGQLKIPNPDFDPFGPQSFMYSGRTWSGYVIVSLFVVAWLSCLYLVRKRAERAISSAVLLAVLTVVSLSKERAVPFFLMSTLPIISSSYGRLCNKNWMASVEKILIAIVWLALLPTHFFQLSGNWGFGIDESVYPVKSVNFINENRPEPNIYHTPVYGNYILGHLPSYKVFIDTREFPFRKIDQRVAEAFHSPQKTVELLNAFNVSTVLMPLHLMGMKPDGTYWDKLGEFFPKETWALVFFDRISMVWLRRMPEHQSIISKYEYRQLRPNIPPSSVVSNLVNKPEALEELAQEAKRCFEKVSDQWVCVAAELALAKARGDSTKVSLFAEALDRLGNKYGLNPFLEEELRKSGVY